MAFLFAVLPSPSLLSAEGVVVPTDFKVVAQYGAGYSDWKSWKVTIGSDGQVLQEIYVPPNDNEREKHQQKTYRLTKEDLLTILAKIQESDFFALSESYSYPVTDNPSLLLAIAMNQKSHEVKVYAPDFVKDKGSVKKFLKVWNAVLRKVPSPNPKQTAE